MFGSVCSCVWGDALKEFHEVLPQRSDWEGMFRLEECKVSAFVLRGVALYRGQRLDPGRGERDADVSLPDGPGRLPDVPGSFEIVQGPAEALRGDVDVPGELGLIRGSGFGESLKGSQTRR